MHEKHEIQELEPSYMDPNFLFAWYTSIRGENKLRRQFLGSDDNLS